MTILAPSGMTSAAAVEDLIETCFHFYDLSVDLENDKNDLQVDLVECIIERDALILPKKSTDTIVVERFVIEDAEQREGKKTHPSVRGRNSSAPIKKPKLE